MVGLDQILSEERQI